MKFSCIPFSLALLFWFVFKPDFNKDTKNGDSYNTNPYWSSGPYIIIGATIFSICKGVHFIYYNSKKRMAQNVALYLSIVDEEANTGITGLPG
jgi:hypothetical protein